MYNIIVYNREHRILKKSLNGKNKTSLHYDNDEEVSSCKMWCQVGNKKINGLSL